MHDSTFSSSFIDVENFDPTSPHSLKALAHASAAGVVPEATCARRLAEAPDAVLFAAAREITRIYAEKTFNFCSIVNAKSGRCSEDCAWCAQSRRFQTAAAEYPLLSADEILRAARATAQAGVPRFSLVTSGRKLSPREVRETAELVRRIRTETDLEVCLSAGLLTESELAQLFAAGVCRCHCNLESSRSRFAELCTTHTTDEKIATLAAARRVGMDICSGGIIGMGECETDRIDLALELRHLAVGSIPINILHPIPGTPLADAPLISDNEILRAIALFRLINPRAQLRFAGGRARLEKSTQLAALALGINSAITGDMLTTVGSAAENDRALVREAELLDERDSPEAFDRAHLWHPYAGTVRPPVVHRVVGAEGVRIRLADGRELIDGTSSWWCALFGYGRPELIDAAKRQAESLAHVMFGGLTHDPAVELGRRLLAIVPRGLTRIFYADSGSVAVEVAMKTALQFQAAEGHPGRRSFLTLRHGYHGDTRNAMSVCDPDGMHAFFDEDRARRIFIESPASLFEGDWDPHDLDELARVLQEKGGEIAAFILEPIVQGAGAMRFYHPEYLKGARELCTRHGVLLICDEIATGFGRTGRAFACDWAGITPDIMTIGKGLTGGFMTLSAMLATTRVSDAVSGSAPYALMHGPTFMANPLACSVACAAIDLYANLNIAQKARTLQERLRASLEPLAALSGVVDVRVCGAIGVVEVAPEKACDLRVLQERFVEAGVWVRPMGTLFYLMPPIVIDEDDLARLLDGFTRVLTNWLTGRHQ